MTFDMSETDEMLPVCDCGTPFEIVDEMLWCSKCDDRDPKTTPNI
jgi:hypothetical protein